jgi:tRNA-splicing ligase RtcB (3'-phosphate/5'-hydroxy nucleic acid ligase)
MRWFIFGNKTSKTMTTMPSNIFGKHDQQTLQQFEAVSRRAVRSALMSDGHLGYVAPIGSVLAYRNEVSPSNVGYDISCGNCAIRTNKKLSDIGVNTEKIQWMLGRYANEIQKTISFGIGRTNKADDAPTDHKLFKDDAWSIVPRAYKNHLFDKAVEQLGTVGSGNHYVDVFVDENDDLWVGVHFGSRGLGHTIASAYLAIGQGGQWGDQAKENEVIFNLLSTAGQEYWALMELAGQYAYAGREWVARKVVEILGAKEVEMVHNHHNFAWKEEHFLPIYDGTGDVDEIVKEELVVVRKGATPAFIGQKGFVGGSMGDNSVILEGIDDQDSGDQQDALFSTVHGAGRVMSRTEAKGKVNRRTGMLKIDKITGEPVKKGKISDEMMQDWITKKGVILRGGGVDEAPQAYRRLDEVLQEQGSTIKILHTLRPLIVVMAGANEHDPYKD